jgi:hypothetical protein
MPVLKAVPKDGGSSWSLHALERLSIRWTGTKPGQTVNNATADMARTRSSWIQMEQRRTSSTFLTASKDSLNIVEQSRQSQMLQFTTALVMNFTEAVTMGVRHYHSAAYVVLARSLRLFQIQDTARNYSQHLEHPRRPPECQSLSDIEDHGKRNSPRTLLYPVVVLTMTPAEY